MKPIIVWFRQDLRLAGNPALTHAAKSGQPLLCLYVLDDETPGPWAMGAASRWWLHHSLTALAASLAKLGGALVLRRGRGETVVRGLARETGAQAVVWNRCYEPYAVAHDKALKAALAADNIAAESFNGALLFEPWEIRTRTGTPFRVFTPFWKALGAMPEPPTPPPAPKKPVFHTAQGEALDDWRLLPRHPDWARDFTGTPGEKGAQQALYDFLERMDDYAAARDIPGRDGTSQLSAHLHFGEIGPRQVWQAVRTHGAQGEKFLSELAWRDFNHHLLFHHPTLPEEPFDSRFARMKWRKDARALAAWQRGRTGIPIVDAGMRELWRTGRMHNRVRMIAASFLIKHLGMDWRAGEAWFWDTLTDADLANNAANWQWVAGCGADAAPFFRVFNPVLQGEKFDPAGAYVRRFVPELADVPDKFIHRPWEAPAPPKDYPPPIMALAAGRDRALAAFRALKG